MRILFYYPSCPYHFTWHALEKKAVGGTESSLMRVAHGLAKENTVYIAQKEINQQQEIEGVHYISLQTALALPNLDHVIMLQEKDQTRMQALVNAHQKAKFAVWLHNIPSKRLYKLSAFFVKYHFTLIGVSDFHAARIQKRVTGGLLNRFKKWLGNGVNVPVLRIYNSISSDFVPDQTNWQPTKLLTMSAPTKGLELTLAMFKRVRARFPNLHLYVARPWVSEVGELPEGVTFLGALPQTELRRHIKEAFCIFYPQWRRVETFGLVYAEANALGTPFLAHNFGAAPEVLSHPAQLIDGRDEEVICSTLTHWQTHRPKVWLKEEFKVENVLIAWQNYFKKSSL